MSREILFRGKHIHTLPGNKHLEEAWIYGYLCNENHINSPELEGEFLIDPGTVCQYTGLTDMHGDKIFEGDIVKLPAEDSNFVMEWDLDTACYKMHGDGIVADFDNYWGKEVEVIGNRFDTPELLIVTE